MAQQRLKGKIVDRNRISKRYPYIRAQKRNSYLGDKNLEIETATLTFSNEHEKDVVFEFEFLDANYTVALSTRQTVADTIDSAGVNIWVEDGTVTKSGFTIGASAAFTGEVDVVVVKIGS